MEISIIPRLIIKKLSTNYYRQNDINILISNTFIIVFFMVFKNSLIDTLNSIPHFCLFNKITGVRCPVCGTTRAICSIFKGNFNEAYHFNHFSFCILFFFFLQVPLRLISIYKIALHSKINTISKRISVLILILITVDWVITLIIN